MFTLRHYDNVNVVPGSRLVGRGTAMMEVIHDIAPAAALLRHSKSTITCSLPTYWRCAMSITATSSSTMWVTCGNTIPDGQDHSVSSTNGAS